MNQTSAKMILVCLGRSCRHYGASQVLAAFKAQPVSAIEVEARYCFGHCGNGPMVLVLPEQSWYCRVQPQQVPAILNSLV